MRRAAAACALVLGALAAAPSLVRAADDWSGRNVIEVSLGGSTHVGVTGSVGKVTLTDPKIAEVSATGRGLLIVGRQVGETNLIMYGSGGQSTYLIKVTLPARAIQSELSRMFPGQEIEARAVGGSLVLVGTVSDTHMVSQAEEVALGYLRSPSFAALGVKPHVINLLRVSGKQQVMLEVKFAEVKRTSLREIGVDGAGGTDEGKVGVALGPNGVLDTNPRLGNDDQVRLLRRSKTVGDPDQVFNPRTGAVGALFIGNPSGAFPFAATLSVLAERNLARTLAEPTLVAMSGQKAKFLAGGEVPFSVANLQGVTVQFKEFGIGLEFTPVVQGEDTIQLHVRTEVSAVDPALSLVINTQQGARVTPGFKKRSSETTIRLRDGQSFAIAGLLNDEMNNIVRKVPGLGDLPVLGVLFSSKEFQRQETELLVVATVRLVQPMDAGAVPPLPGEREVTDPTDLELFLLNVHETSGTRAPAGKMDSVSGTGLGSTAPRRRPVGKIGFWR